MSTIAAVIGISCISAGSAQAQEAYCDGGFGPIVTQALKVSLWQCANSVYFSGKGKWGGYDLRVKVSGKVFLSGQYVGRISVSPSQQACRRGSVSACNQWEANLNQQHEMIMQQTRDDGERLRKFADYLR
jgi:hypothetical protein